MTTTESSTKAAPIEPPPGRRSLADRLPRWIRTPKSLTLLVVVVLTVFFGAFHPDEFLTAYNQRNIAIEAAGYLILAVGMTFVITTGGIDLSVGSVLVFSGAVGVKVMVAVGGDGPAALIAGLVATVVTGVLWGLVNGFLVTVAGLPSLIATLATLSAAYGGALVLTDGLDLRGVPESLSSFLGFGRFLGVPYIVWLAVLVTIVGAVVMSRTRFGLYTSAVGSNDEAARRVGVRVDRHLVKIYAVSGGLAGLAGYVSLARFSTTSVAGHQTDNLQAIIATVLGGTSLFGGVGSVIGTAFGSLIPAILNNGLVIFGLPPYWQQVAVGGVLAGVVFVDHRNRKRRTQK